MDNFQKIWEEWKKDHDDKYRDLAFNKLKPKIDNDIKSIHNIPRSALEAEYSRAVYKAFDTYDPKKGSFKTHLFNNLKRANRFVYQHKYDLYVPEYQATRMNTYTHALKELKEELNREPSAAELADYLGWDIKDVETMEAASNKGTYMLENAGYVPKENDDLEALVEMIYYSVGPREQSILDYIFGMHGKPALKTNADISKRTGIPLSTVKRLRAKLFDQIRSYMNG